MGILLMNHRQDADATKPHGQDARATFHTLSQREHGGPFPLRRKQRRPGFLSIGSGCDRRRGGRAEPPGWSRAKKAGDGGDPQGVGVLAVRLSGPLKSKPFCLAQRRQDRKGNDAGVLSSWRSLRPPIRSRAGLRERVGLWLRRKAALGVLAVATVALTSCRSSEWTFHTVRYGDPDRPFLIASRGRAQVPELIAFFTETNPRVDFERLYEIARAYLDEAAAEGINSDIAFCQMVHETDYLRFGGDARAWQNNFCGLGVTGGGRPGLSFSSVRLGVRAHIQHLKAYANAEPLRQRCVDPRFTLVRRARAPFVEDLAGTWAADPQYGVKLKCILAALETHLDGPSATARATGRESLVSLDDWNIGLGGPALISTMGR
jgi:hypothetical protein